MIKPPRNKGALRLINATKYSWDGLKQAWQTEEAFRQELWLAAAMIPFSLLIDITAIEHALLIFAVMLVLIVELLNTGLEVLVERISPDYHELSKYAKDVGSAAVFLSLINAGVIWALILFF